MMDDNNELYWHKCDENGDPMSDYDGFGWVIVQFVENNTGFKPIPMVAEYHKHTNKWFHDSVDKNNVDYYQNLKALAWFPMPIYKETKPITGFRERYRKIAESEMFIKHYYNKSLGDTIDIVD